jgi:hypothetical protein
MERKEGEERKHQMKNLLAAKTRKSKFRLMTKEKANLQPNGEDASSEDVLLPTPEEQLQRQEREKRDAFVRQIEGFLENDPELRSIVFHRIKENARKRIETLRKGEAIEEILQMQKREKDNANALAVLSQRIRTGTLQEKTKALQSLVGEIADRQQNIDKNERAAANSMNLAVTYAKEIGDRLQFAKDHLIPEGQYEKWVEETFDGIFKPSTARLYRQIAAPQNWKKIAKKVNTPPGLSLRAARALLTDKPEKQSKSEIEKTRAKLEKKALEKFRELIAGWPPKMLDEVTFSNAWFWGRLDKEAQKLCNPSEMARESARNFRRLLNAQRQMLNAGQFSPADLLESDFH